MPKDFTDCISHGGKVVTETHADNPSLKSGQYMHVCHLNGKRHEGEIKMDVAKASQDFQSIEIRSDGSRAGTKIKINGVDVDNLENLTFNWWDDDYSPNVGLNFTLRDPPPTPGSLQQYTHFSLVPPANPEDAKPAGVGVLNAAASVPADKAPRLSRRRMYAQM